MKISPGSKILDVGCGTGSFEMAIADVVDAGNLSSQFSILAIDYSEAMIDKLRQKVLPRLSTVGLVPSRFEVDTKLLDGETLQGIENESFDFAVSSFGLVLFQNRDKCFANVLRVLKPGGTLLFNVWEPTPKELGFGIIDAVNAINEFLKPIDSATDRSQTAPSSSPSKTNQEAMLDALGDAGFLRVSSFSTYHSLCFDSPDFFWNWLLRCSPRVGKPIAALPPNEADQLRRTVLGRFSPSADARLVLTNHGVTYVANKP